MDRVALFKHAYSQGTELAYKEAGIAGMASQAMGLARANPRLMGAGAGALLGGGLAAAGSGPENRGRNIAMGMAGGAGLGAGAGQLFKATQRGAGAMQGLNVARGTAGVGNSSGVISKATGEAVARPSGRDSLKAMPLPNKDAYSAAAGTTGRRPGMPSPQFKPPGPAVGPSAPATPPKAVTNRNAVSGPRADYVTPSGGTSGQRPGYAAPKVPKPSGPGAGANNASGVMGKATQQLAVPPQVQSQIDRQYGQYANGR